MNMKKQLLAMTATWAMAVGLALGQASPGTSAPIAIDMERSLDIDGHAEIGIWPSATVLLDGVVLFSSAVLEQFDWQPQVLGAHELACQVDGVVVSRKTVTVTNLAFEAAKEPTPPTAVDSKLSITPTTKNFGTAGGGTAILVSGSGTWTASTSEEWITLNATSGEAGYPVAYAVGATTNADGRTGYVYVSGHVHTVTQDGLGAVISPGSTTCESTGERGTITVETANEAGWRARSNVDWINVNPTTGTGEGTVTYAVAPFNEVDTRQGTLTVAGKTFSVFQYGRRMKLGDDTATNDYLSHTTTISVNALASTEWGVTPNASWISVVDAGTGKGMGQVTISIAENPSWKSRTGTVSIGTETFTVIQGGRTALVFTIAPTGATANVNGGNGVIAVTATPDLPWRAESQTNWLTIYPLTSSGAGNGNVVYSATPNTSLYERTGTIRVTSGDASMPVRVLSVVQQAAASALSREAYEFAAAGDSCEVAVSLADNVEWQIENTNTWLAVEGATNRTGPATVTLQAMPNNTTYPRSGMVTIARKTFHVSQLAQGVEVEYDTKLFGQDGGDATLAIHPNGPVAWTAVASDPTWLIIFQGASGTGAGEVMYIVAPYVGDGGVRTGTITVGDKVVYITQRSYDLSIDPAGSVVAGNNGAGEFGVSATIGEVWTAIVTEPWITLVSGYDHGTGSGTVRFLYTDNDTGKTRTGKIIVAGEVYTLTQRERQFVTISAEAEHGGTVTGAGTFDLGTQVTLTAVPDSGYAFSYWTGAVESMENPLVFNADVPKSFTAVFEPLPIAFESVTSDTNGVTLAWNHLAWATHYLLYRGVTSVPSSATVVADIPNTGICSYLDETGEVGVEYWYWIEAEGVEDDVTSDPMTGMKLKPPAWPDVEDEAGVAAVLAGAADARLAERIQSVEEYDAFRAWIAATGLDGEAVKASARAWPSYLLGAEALFENEPVIRMEGFSLGGEAEGSRAAGEVWTVRVTVRDGERAVAVDGGKMAELFEATRDVGDWGEETQVPLEVEATGTEGDGLLFEVRPGAEGLSGAFLRLGE